MNTLEMEIERTIARLHELSTDGKAPTLREYTANRGQCYNISFFTTRGISWKDLCHRAGLLTGGIANNLETEIARTIQRLHELSTDGKAPTMREYESNLDGLRSINYFRDRGIVYSELCRRAGLTCNTPGVKSGAPSAQRDGVPPYIEREIQNAFAGHDRRRSEWPLSAIPTRIEVQYIPLPDGSIYRRTRSYASLR